MGCLLPVLATLLLVYQASGYRCDDGQCPQSSDQCCNPHILDGVCCPARGTCCYHGNSNKCCGPREQCCWDKRHRDVACCPPGTFCCPMNKRGTCCIKTPIFIWILLGICGSIIVLLLLLSLIQCIQEEMEEYQTQRTSGSLPSDNAWYYYDYGSTMTRSPRGSGFRRAPPEYEPPPPSYSNHDTSRSSQSTPAARPENGARPKPPTPQTRQHVTTATESRASEYYSTAEGRSSAAGGSAGGWESEYGSTTSRGSETGPNDAIYCSGENEVLKTLYQHPVPKLQRMLCSQHNCLVTDGSCVYCMDLAENEDIEVMENKETRKLESLQKHVSTINNLDQQTIIH